MVIISIFVIYLALKKKDYRCLPVCIFACVYSVMHSIFRTPNLAETMLHDVLSAISIPLLVAWLIVTVWTFRRPFENNKHYILPIIFCAGILADKTIRRILFFVQTNRLTEVGADAAQIFQQVSFVSNVLDIVYTILFYGIIVSIVCVLNRTKMERTS